MYEQGSIISAEEIIALKADVKAEMLRRALTGSLSTYGSASWDFDVVPARGIKIETEHFDKIKTPVSKINTDGLPTGDNDKFPALDGLNGKLQTYKTYTGKSSTTHGCASSCSGLCYSACTSCSGCSGGCTGCGSCSGCGSGCASGCNGCDGCSGCGSGCASGCSGGCYTSCSGCGSGCADSCSGCDGCSGCGTVCTTGCGSTCGSGCTNYCSGGCKSGCTGCDGCDNTCSGNCSGKVMFGG